MGEQDRPTAYVRHNRIILSIVFLDQIGSEDRRDVALEPTDVGLSGAIPKVFEPDGVTAWIRLLPGAARPWAGSSA